MSRQNLVWLLAVLSPVATHGDSVRAAEPEWNAELVAKLHERVCQSTVWIVVPVGKDDIYTGTGSLIDLKQKIVLTSFDIVADHDEVKVFFPVSG